MPNSGFVIETIHKELSNDSLFINQLNKLFSYNENCIIGENIEPKPKELKVLSNLISRGYPTRLSLQVEQELIQLIKYNLQENFGSLYFIGDELSQDLLELAKRAVYIIDPRISLNTWHNNQIPKSFEELDSEFEEGFLFDKLNSFLNDSILQKLAAQVIQPQRSLESLLDVEKLESFEANNFHFQRADFVIEFPQEIDGRKGLVIEIDGSQHNLPIQKKLDNQRDIAVSECGWETIRIKTNEWGSCNDKLQRIKNILDHEIYNTHKENLRNPIYSIEDGKIALLLILTPIAISRIQKSLTNLVNLSNTYTRIAVIERDVPCGRLAVDDFYNQLKNLFSLKGEDFNQSYDLQIFYSEDFIDFDLRSNEDELIPENTERLSEFDIILDISTLSSTGVIRPLLPEGFLGKYCIIESDQYFYRAQPIETDSLINYGEIVNQLSESEFEDIPEKKDALEFFLRNIFRKKEYRIGQLPILNRALQRESVIGLLPTGGGKSLTYQIATLLQPGINLVIDPIKSLMQDQVFGLEKNLISSCTFLNSSIRGIERKKAERRISKGHSLFNFVSPERLQIQRFRAQLNGLFENNIYFSYVVIDEAHCVSEWGHDFRTSYLSLGENARKYCRTASESPIPLFALTATASFDVLADIQRELSPFEGQEIGNEAQVRFESIKRNELQYYIQEINFLDVLPEGERIDPNDLNDIEIKSSLGALKQLRLNELIREIPNLINDYQNDPLACLEDGNIEDHNGILIENFDQQNFFLKLNNAGVIFCPHRGWYFGVTDTFSNPERGAGIFENIEIPELQKGTFMGSDNDDAAIANRIDETNIENQKLFIENELNLLVATKAFGMGIDKPNIRYTIHNNYPQSIESFVQESGRAGRDGKIAVSCIQFCDDLLVGENENRKPNDRAILEDFHNNSFKGSNKEKRTIFELLRNIRFPAQTRLTQINNEIFIENNIEIKANYWHSQNGNEYLFIQNGRDINYGSILLGEQFHCYFDRANQPRHLCNEYVGFFLTKLEETNHRRNGRQWGAFLNQRIAPQQEEGLEKLLEDLEIGTNWSKVVGFQTDLERLANKVGQIISPIVNANVTPTSQIFRNSQFDSFYNELKGNYRSLPDIGDNQELENQLKKVFEQARIKSDTEKAIFRLMIIGVIDDYTVDFNANTFTISGTRKSDDEILESLRGYIKRYYSEVRTNRIIEEEIINRPGENIIQKCLNFLIEFIYKEVANKRFQGIEAMRTACSIGARNGNVAFKEFIDLYFNSKYARSDYQINGENASLLSYSDEGRKSNLSIIWKFIEITNTDPSGSQNNNLKHLRGASIRILISNPKNYALLILKAFSEFVIEFSRNVPNDRIIEGARDSFLDGLNILVSEEKLTVIQTREFLKKFRNRLFENYRSIEVEEYILKVENLYILENHKNWLLNFNKKLAYANN